jgi:hypothetical protein
LEQLAASLPLLCRGPLFQRYRTCAQKTATTRPNLRHLTRHSAVAAVFGLLASGAYTALSPSLPTRLILRTCQVILIYSRSSEHHWGRLHISSGSDHLVVWNAKRSVGALPAGTDQLDTLLPIVKAWSRRPGD